MNNSSLLHADGATHLKIVAVSLLAGILVVVVGIAARPHLDLGLDGFTAGTTRLEAQGPVIRAGQPIVWTSRDTNTLRR